MSNFVLSCCSTADLTNEHLASRGISYLPFTYYLDDEPYTDDLGQSMPSEEFYQRMVDGADTKTSQPNAEKYMEYFSSILESGKDVLHLVLSSGISGSYNSAMIAKEELEGKFPGQKLYVVDSLSASSGTGLIMETLADMRDDGADIDTLLEWIEEHKLNMHHWFFSTDLTFFIKGGRVSKAAGLFGTMLKICPLLNVSVNGKLVSREKIRGKAAAARRAVEMMETHAEGGLDYNGKCYISHSNCIEDALDVKAQIEEKFKNLNGEVLINNIGTTIGSHAGPGTVALFFWGDKRED